MLFVQSHLVADHGTERHPHLFGHARRDRNGRNPPRLRHDDVDGAPPVSRIVEKVLWDLGGLAAPRVSGDDGHLERNGILKKYQA